KADSHTDFVAPRTPAEQTLANIWCRLLNLEQVGVHDDFFVLGGHSLIATQLVSQIRQELNVDIQLRTIFSNPTIESLALELLQQKASASSPHEVDGLLAEIESLSDASAELQSRSATSQFHCPETKSPLFGRRHCNLIMLINERFDMASFERVAEYVRDFDSTINAVVIPDSASNHALPDLPTLTFSPAVIRHTRSQAGRIFAGYPLSKNEEYRALVQADIPVPNWVLVTERVMPDLSAFDDFVVQKPNYGGMSAEVIL